MMTTARAWGRFLAGLALLAVLGLASCGDSNAEPETCTIEQNGSACSPACQAGTICALVYLSDGPQTTPTCVGISPACGEGCVSCECMSEEACPMCSPQEQEGQTYLSCDEFCGPDNINHCF